MKSKESEAGMVGARGVSLRKGVGRVDQAPGGARFPPKQCMSMVAQCVIKLHC